MINIQNSLNQIDWCKNNLKEIENTINLVTNILKKREENKYWQKTWQKIEIASQRIFLLAENDRFDSTKDEINLILESFLQKVGNENEFNRK